MAHQPIRHLQVIFLASIYTLIACTSTDCFPPYSTCHLPHWISRIVRTKCGKTAVSWAVSKFFFFSYFILLLLTNFFRNYFDDDGEDQHQGKANDSNNDPMMTTWHPPPPLTTEHHKGDENGRQATRTRARH